MEPNLFRAILIGLPLASCSLEKSGPATGGKRSGAGESTKTARPRSPVDQALAYSAVCGKDSLKAFYNDMSDGDDFIRYEWRKEIDAPQGAFFERSYYEGGDWFYLSMNSCSVTDLFGPVAWNPSKGRFASFGQDNVAGFSANGVQIFSFAKGSGEPEKELEDTLSIEGASQYGPSRWAWENDSVISVVLADLDGNEKVRTYSYVNRAWGFRDSALSAGPKRQGG